MQQGRKVLFALQMTRRRPTRLLLAATLLLLLQACSAVRVVYNQADSVLAWMADDYFDFDAAQKQDFHARLAPLLAWHRREQLPDYAKLLAEASQRLQRGAAREDAHWLIDGVQGRYRIMAMKAAPDITDLLHGLHPGNLKALERQFDRVNHKFAREHRLNGTPDEQRRERLERTVKRIRDWTGPLTSNQLERIGVLNDAVPNTDALRQQDRQRRQKEFIAMLKQRGNKAEFTRTLTAWLADWEKGRTPETRAALQESYDKRIALYLEVERMLTAEQRAHLQQRLRGYIADIAALTAHNTAQP
jgi:hypothetical protein